MNRMIELLPYAPAIINAWLFVACFVAWRRSDSQQSNKIVWYNRLLIGFSAVMLTYTSVLMLKNPTGSWISKFNWLMYSLWSLLGWYNLRGWRKSPTTVWKYRTVSDFLLLRAPQEYDQPVSQRSTNGLRLVFAVSLIALVLGLASIGLRSCHWLDRWIQRSGCQAIIWSPSGVQAVKFSPDGKTLAISGSENHIDLVRVADQAVVRSLVQPEDWIDDIAYSPDGATLASTGRDKLVRLWNVADGQVKQTLAVSLSNDYVYKLGFTRDGQSLAVGMGAGQNKVGTWLWRMSDNTITQKFPASSWYFALNSEQSIIAVPNDDDTIALKNLADGTTLRTISTPQFSQMLEFSPDGNFLFTISNDALLLWRTADGELEKTIGVTDLRTATFSPNGQTLAISTFNLENDRSTLMLWRIDAPQPFYTRTIDHAFIDQLVYAPDGETLALATAFQKIYLWNVPR